MKKVRHCRQQQTVRPWASLGSFGHVRISSAALAVYILLVFTPAAQEHATLSGGGTDHVGHVIQEAVCDTPYTISAGLAPELIDSI